MIARLPKLLLVLALACSIGLHWAFLQSVAWVGMIAHYSRNATIGEALAKTFDGRHPCALCRHIAEHKKTEKKPEAGFDLKKLEFPYARVVFIFCAPSAFWEVRALNESAEGLTHGPAAPPPRDFLA